MSDSPWRFLTPLSQRAEDRELLQLTRGDDLQVVVNMLAASRVVLLYAASGSGKSSLINAGIVPFFTEQGYAVIRTRPRPPGSTESPVEAFRQCALRDYVLPVHTREAAELVRSAREQLAALGPDAADDVRKVFELVDPQLEQLLSRQREPEALKEQMEPLRGGRLKAYLAGLLKALAPGGSGRLLVICDQFEELFVHYANRPELTEFVTQLGEAWSDKSLSVQFLFSMREDWVGSMVEFQSAIPDIFSQVFRLRPIRKSVARKVITTGLSRTTYSVDTDMADRLLNDLANSYGARQTEHHLAAGLPVSPDQDGFVELPAVQLVCDELWRTRDRLRPFSVEHYEWLREHHAAAPEVSPVEAVLHHYLDNYLKAEEAGNTERDLQLDLLYLMTDRISHRRAISEQGMSRELPTVRTGPADKEPPGRARLRGVLEPLIRARLVRREAGTVGAQYELVHDFAVRAIVQSWDRLDRERTLELGRLQRVAEARERRYQTLTAAEDRMLRFLALGPAIAIVLTVAVVGGTFLLESRWLGSYSERDFFADYSRFYSFLSPMRWIALASALLTFGVAILQRHTLGMWFSGLLSILMLPLLSQLLPSPTEIREYAPRSLGLDDALSLSLLTGFAASVLLFYPRLIVSVSRATNGSERVQRVLLVTWTDMINLIGLVAVCWITVILSLLTASIRTPRPALELVVGIGIAAGIAAFVAIHAYFISKWPWHGLLAASGYQVRTSEGTPLAPVRGLRRSILYTVWLALNVLALMPLVLFGPLCIYFHARRIAPYDLLAGTILIHGTKESDRKVSPGSPVSHPPADSSSNAADEAHVPIEVEPG